eukprot:TRINITY_DN27584_c0_g1_i1.p1 TRINITY_DN27584_c0_g1~~TRINITY_DN27584_c0_g1_i1.p1  ORF type:complete len:944 (-),score=378.69 TRINITY_DN27584_c0_g1_i1:202-3033(-)
MDSISRCSSLVVVVIGTFHGGARLRERVQRAAEIFKEFHVPSRPGDRFIVSSGRPERGTITAMFKGSHAAVEAYLMRSFALEAGLPASAVLVEELSKDTVEAAVAVHALLELQPAGYHLIVVTESHHAPRADATFRAVFGGVDLVTVGVPAVVSDTERLALASHEQQQMAQLQQRLDALSHSRAPHDQQPQAAGDEAVLVHCIRHAESLYNEAARLGRPLDMSLVDARLSETGKRQASQQLRRSVASIARETPIELVVCSPLSRAIETATAGFEGHPVRIVVQRDIAEHRNDVCDFGSPTSQLTTRFPHLSFEHLDEVWHRPHDDTEPLGVLAYRVARFKRWLLHERSESCIAIVSHGLYLRHLLELDPAGAGMHNCEIRRLHLHRPRPFRFRHPSTLAAGSRPGGPAALLSTVPPTSAAAASVASGAGVFAAVPAAGIPKFKFQPNGDYNLHHGNTVICFVPRSSPQHALLCAVQDTIARSALGKHFALLPAPSLHMTVYDLLTDSIKGRLAPFQSMSWMQTHRELIRRLAGIMASAPWSVFRVGFESVRIGNTVCVSLRPLGRTAQALAAWRAAVAVHSGVPAAADYALHVTLAYLLTPIAQEAQGAAQALFAELNERLRSQFEPLELGPPELTMFNDMAEFRPLVGSSASDVTALLGYNAVTDRFCRVRFSDGGQTLDLVHTQGPSSSSFSHVVPFVDESRDFVLLYRSTTGDWVVIEVLSTYHQFRKISEGKWAPHLTHVTAPPAWSGRVVCYSAASGIIQLHRWLHQAPAASSPELSWRAGWTSVVKFPWTQTELLLLGYSQETGEAEFALLTADALQLSPHRWSRRWSHFVPFAFGDRPVYLAYSTTDGTAHVTQLESTNSLVDLVRTQWAPGFSLVTSFRLNDQPRFLAYSALTGLALSFVFDGGALLQSAEIQLEPGWTHLGELDFGAFARNLKS